MDSEIAKGTAMVLIGAAMAAGTAAIIACFHGHLFTHLNTQTLNSWKTIRVLFQDIVVGLASFICISGGLAAMAFGSSRVTKACADQYKKIDLQAEQLY